MPIGAFFLRDLRTCTSGLAETLQMNQFVVAPEGSIEQKQSRVPNRVWSSAVIAGSCGKKPTVLLVDDSRTKPKTASVVGDLLVA